MTMTMLEVRCEGTPQCQSVRRRLPFSNPSAEDGWDIVGGWELCPQHNVEGLKLPSRRWMAVWGIGLGLVVLGMAVVLLDVVASVRLDLLPTLAQLSLALLSGMASWPLSGPLDRRLVRAVHRRVHDAKGTE